MNTTRAAIVGLLLIMVVVPTAAVAQTPREAQTIFGPDDRAQVPNTTIAPYRSVVYVESYTSALHLSGESCSGTLIGPNVILTAAHCVYQKKALGGWAYQTRVWAARNGLVQPFAPQYGVGWVPQEWITYSANSDQQPTLAQFYDYGIIVLPDSTLGQSAGWLKVGALADASLSSAFVAIAGYDGDKPAATMWVRAGGILPSPWQLTYVLDSKPGSSGSGIFRTSDNVVVGINTYESADANWGHRIDANVMSFLSGACLSAGCSYSVYTESAPTALPTVAPTATATSSPTPIATSTPQPTVAATGTGTRVPSATAVPATSTATPGRGVTAPPLECSTIPVPGRAPCARIVVPLAIR